MAARTRTKTTMEGILEGFLRGESRESRLLNLRMEGFLERNSTRSTSFHHGLGDLDPGGPDEDDEDAGEDEEDERDHDLARRLGGAFLGELPTLQAHRVGEHAQGRADARSELLGLDDHRR